MIWLSWPAPVWSLMYIIMHWCWGIDSLVLRFWCLANKLICCRVDVCFSYTDFVGTIKPRTVIRTWQCSIRSTRCPIDVCFCRDILWKREIENFVTSIYFNFKSRLIKEMDKLCSWKGHSSLIYKWWSFSTMTAWLWLGYQSNNSCPFFPRKYVGKIILHIGTFKKSR